MKKNNFKKKALIVAIAPLMLSSLAYAELSTTATKTISDDIIQNIKVVTRGSDVLLWDQTLGTIDSSAPDQDFETAYDAYDSEVADDFVITDPGGWIINEVRTIGSHNDFDDGGDPPVITGQGGPTQSVHLTFYSDNAGLPGSAMPGCSFTNLTTDDQADGNGDPSGTLFTLIPGGCTLPPGSYWMGYQAQQDFATQNQHFAAGSSDTITANQAAYQNPGDGFGTGCTTFGALNSTCGLSATAGPMDLVFVMFGEILGMPEPDLALTKTNDTNGNPVTMGTNITYTLTLDNVGVSGASTNVVLTDTMPAGMGYVSASCDDGTSGVHNHPTITFNTNDIAFGASTVCTVVLTVNDFGEFINNATVTSDGDVDNTNDSATSTVTGPNEVDMSIVKTSDAGGQLAENATLIYTLAVTNNDLTDSGTNVVATDVLPAEVTYVSNDCGASVAGSTVTWNAGSVPANTTANCNITTTVTGFGTFGNTATVAGDDTDNTPDNNTSSVIVDGPIAVTGVDLVMSKTSDAVGVLALNDTVTYTLTVTNISVNDATSVTVSDALPAGLELCFKYLWRISCR